MGVSVLLLLFAAAAFGADFADAKGKGRVVVAPKPGQSVERHGLRIVVNAGPNRGDLRARLNGVRVTRFFSVAPKGRRVLRASSAHGLRHGRNVLKVSVRSRGEQRRRATVRFRVAHTLPLTAAGVDRRVFAGKRVRLQGEVRLHRSDSGLRGVRWQLVKAPGKSRFGPGASASTLRKAVRGARTMKPIFKPDVPGRYTVKLSSRSGNGRSSDRSVLYVVPKSLMLTLQTAVPPSKAEPQPGIRVGGKVYRAPYMLGKNYSEEGKFVAEWQVLAFDRTTMTLLWNRTYGFCLGNRGGSNGACREVEGKVRPVAFGEELEKLGANSLVIATSHFSLPREGGEWGVPNAEGLAVDNLDEIGLPGAKDTAFVAQLNAARAGTVSVVGVPGMKPGDADLIVAPNGQGLNGYLTPDANTPPHYVYAASARFPFEAGPAPCAASEECTARQVVGEEVEGGTMPNGRGGFLVTAFDRHDLSRQASQVFVTASDGQEAEHTRQQVAEMASFLEKWSQAGALIAVTGFHGHNQSVDVLYDSGTSADTWGALASAMAKLGASVDAFNTAASTAAGFYSMVGWGGLLEGEAAESSNGGRLWGVLAPDNRSEFEATNVSTTGPPSDGLEELVMGKPEVKEWPLANDAGATKAIEYIGGEVNTLGPEPRSAYVTQNITKSNYGSFIREIERHAPYKTGLGFTQADYKQAFEQLSEELEYVGKVRTYLAFLARPTEESGKSAWEEASKLQDTLEAELEDLKASAEASFEWFTMIESLFEFAAIPEWKGALKNLEKAAAAIAIGFELSQSLYSKDWSGSPNSANRIKADELATHLKVQSEEHAATFKQLGDLIVNDWNKLSILGAHAECVPKACGAEYEDFASTTQMKEVAKAATLRARDRTIYETLVPLSYPIWNTGLAEHPERPGTFGCVFDYSPFTGAPRWSYAWSLERLDPTGAANEWRVYLSVGRDSATYGWMSEKISNRMFAPVPENVIATAGGLGIDPLDFMRSAIRESEYQPSTTCYWGYNGEE